MTRKVETSSTIITSESGRSDVEFTVDHVHDIRSAVVCLLDAVATIVELKDTDVPDSYYNMTQQVYALNEKIFKSIHDRYLWWSSSFSERHSSSNLHHHKHPKPMIRTMSHHGFAIKYSRVEADRFLKSLVTAFDACKSALLQSLKRKSERETSLYQQLINIKGDLQERESELTLANIKLDDVRREKEKWESRLDELKQNLEAARTKISVLERFSSVVTWQSDLDKIISQHTNEMDEMKSMLDSERKLHRETCDMLKEKIKKLENELRRQKFKNQVPVNQTASGLVEKLDHSKQQLFLREQELYKAKKELTHHNQNILGCLNGLQQDFRYLLSKWEHDNPGRKFNPDPDNLKFQAMLRCVHEACMKDTLSELGTSLPSHYAPAKLEPVVILKRKPTSESINQSKPSVTRKDVLSMPVMKTRSHSVHVPPFKGKTGPELSNRPSSARTDTDHSKSKEKINFQKPRNLNQAGEGGVKNPHPQLVNPVTGRANLLQVMKHFPYLTVEQVTSQWDNFRKYDRNRDFSLDITELYDVITRVCGLKVTVREMKEAMQEVDRDKSNNIDFYEYLKIAEMIIRKQGNASIFKSDMLQERGVTTSKACVIQ